MPDQPDLIGQYSIALDRADALMKGGLISPDQHKSMADQLLEILKNPPAARPTVAVPMPRPDPRGSTFVERNLPRAVTGSAPDATEIPPDLMLAAKGIDPTRKQGDAIDYPAPPSLYYMTHPSPGWNT